MKRIALLCAVLAAAALPASTSAHATKRITVLAAASLTDVAPKIDPGPLYSFGGSDQLAFQIQQGAPVDVFLAASPKYPEQLYQQGLVEKPIPFATNTLVLVLPKSNPAHIRRVDDLARPGVRSSSATPRCPSARTRVRC